MKDPNRFYTYAYLREDRTPYYIGKGKGNRAYRKRKDGINPPKDKLRIIFLKQNLTEEEAFKHEIYMIAVFGRKDLGTGILYNKTNGGEGSSGAVVSEETRKKLSEKTRGENNPNYDKRHSEETKRKQSEVKKGKNNPNYGKRHSEETKRKQSELMKGENNPNYGKKGENNPNYGRKHSEESRRKISKKLKGKFAGEKNPNYGKRGKNSPNYGKKHTEEYKAKMSKDRMGEKNPFYGRKHSEETRKKMSTRENNSNVKTFSVISSNGEIIHSKNCSKFCRDNNLNNSKFSQLLSGKIKSHKGFRLYGGEDT
jgi:hypothetical protein